MTRFVFPELFHAAAAQIVAGGQARVGLRWILHSSVGMPRALFKVWHFEGRVPTKEMSVSSQALDSGGRLLSWTIGPAAAVQLTVTVPAGASLALRGFSGAGGTGHCADEETVVGPATNRGIVLFGSPIASVTLTGTGTVSAARIIPIQAFVNDAGWKLVETVGLPATEAFATTGYPLDPLGPVGAERPPVDAAIARVLRGSPDAGWSGVTDRGTAVPGFVLPDPTQLVTKELSPLVAIVGRMLQDVSEPSKHALASYPVTVKAPRSVHGTEASAHWQNKQHASELFPLGSMLIAAGTDPFAALALGFGTTVDLQAQQPAISIATPSLAFNFYMITVEHKVTVKLRLAPGFPPVDVVVAGELATLCMELQPPPALPPAALSAEPGPLDPPRHIDPPGVVDGRWLEAPNVSWAVPVVPADSTPRPTGYAVARGLGAGPMEIRTEARLSGGWTPFIAAEDPDHEPAAVVRYTDDEVPERFPGDTNTVVYSVAATDWFGRWTDWVSADHSRITVPPQVPAVRRVTLDVPASTAPVFSASASVELTWDWSHRRPREITIRVLVHADGTAPPAVNGSVVSVGGPVVADTVIDFSGASNDSPPSGVLLVADETTGNLRTYRVEIPGLSFAYADHPRVRVTASARATERVGFGLPGAWSPAVSAQAASPIPPPPPFVPAAMTWASIPDPKGVSRITLTWSPSAPRYAVYEADETTVCRELSLPSPNLELASADRLAALRPLPFGQARRAFKRIAGNVAATELPIELPRGSRMIHFYAVVPVSSTGAEGAFPSAGNDYIAVAAPLVQVPEPPALLARDQSGVVALRVDVPETRVRVGKIEIFRAPNRQRAVMPEHAGPPIAVVDAASGTRAGGSIHFEIVDPDPGKAWQSTFYRAVAWAEEHPDRGLRGGRSVPSRAIEVVVSSSAAPPLVDLTIVDVTGAPDHRLLSFQSDATLALTFRGAHVFAVQIVMPDASIVTRRARADTMPLLTGTLPLPAEQPDSIFRHDAINPRAGRTYAWVPREAIAVIAEIADPAGRTTRETRQIP